MENNSVSPTPYSPTQVETELSRWTVEQLKIESEKLGLASTGKKKDIITRLSNCNNTPYLTR